MNACLSMPVTDSRPLDAYFEGYWRTIMFSEPAGDRMNDTLYQQGVEAGTRALMDVHSHCPDEVPACNFDIFYQVIGPSYMDCDAMAADEAL